MRLAWLFLIPLALGGAFAQEPSATPQDDIKALEQELEQLKQQYERQEHTIQELKEKQPSPSEKEEAKKEALKKAIQELKEMLKAQQEELEKLRQAIKPIAIHRKPPSATLRLDGKTVPYSLWIDPSRWDLVPTSKINPLAEYALTHKPSGGNIYAMVIAEPLEVPKDKLKSLVLEQFRQQLPDAHIGLETKRLVDNAELLCLQIEGTLKQLGEVALSLPATYFGCYFTGKPGTIQIITYASNPKLFAQYRKDIEDLMDGFEIRGEEKAP